MIYKQLKVVVLQKLKCLKVYKVSVTDMNTKVSDLHVTEMSK